MSLYEIHTLDMWGHIPADCSAVYGCPCVHTTDEGHDEHDDDKCQCDETCNQSFRAGSIEIPDDASDETILTLLGERDFSYSDACVVDHSCGYIDIRDAQGRHLLQLWLSEES